MIRRSSKTRSVSSKNRPFRPPNQPPHGSTRHNRKALHEGPDGIGYLATPRAARWHRNRQSQSSPHLLFASWVRFIGYRYVTPNGLPTRRCWFAIDPSRHRKITPDMAQLNGGKAHEPSLNSEPGCIKVVDTFRSLWAESRQHALITLSPAFRMDRERNDGWRE